MAITRTKKINANRGWVVIGGDASFSDRYRKVVSTHKTEEEAKQNRRIFDDWRKETDDEVIARLNLD